MRPFPLNNLAEKFRAPSASDNMAASIRYATSPNRYFGLSEIILDAAPKSPLNPLLSRPTEGRLAIVTDAGRDAVDAKALLTNGARCGRQKRVVLTSRCWCQVCGSQLSQMTVAKEPFTGESSL